MKLKYLLLFFISSLLISNTCDKVSSQSKSKTYKICDELADAAHSYWITNKDSTYAPVLIHYCDISFVEAFKDAFSSNKDCRNSITLQEIKLLLGEPDKSTPGVGGIFNIYGARLATKVDTNKTYPTTLYECVTNKKSRFDRSGKNTKPRNITFYLSKKRENMFYLFL